MKKNLTMMAFVACAALTIVSCSNDEVTDSAVKQEQQAVTFGTYVGRGVQSRGTVTNLDALKNTGNFGVTASYTETNNFSAAALPNFMYNQKVTWSGTAWTYNPVKYWPMEKDAQVSFFAYGPYSDNAYVEHATANTDAGYPKIKIVYPGDANLTGMVDFVAAKNVDVKRAASASDPAVDVNFVFAHKMTRLNLKAKLDKSVYDAGVDHHKTKVFVKAVTLDAGGDNLYNGGTYRFADDTWESQNTVSNMSLDVLLNKQAQAFGAKSTKYTTSSIALSDETAVALFQTGEFLFLVPSSPDGASESGLTGGNAYATIEYDIVTEDASLDKGYSISSHKKKVILPTGTLNTPGTTYGDGILKQGVAYDLTFKIALEEVVVTADVTDWATAFGVDPESEVTYANGDVNP